MMDVKIKLALVALLVGACGDDAPPAPEDNGDEEGEVVDASRRDASTRDSSTRDAGRDARAEEEEEEPTEEEPTEEEPVVDAGRSDAGRDAGRDGGRDAGSAASDDCDAVSYEAFASEFIETYCLSCHGAMDPTFNDLDEITPHLDEIRERVLDTTNTALRMPPRTQTQPSSAEKAKLEQWLDCGGK